MDIKREPGKKLILEIGANVKPQAVHVFPDSKIIVMDIDKTTKPDIVMDAGKMNFDGVFDGIVASHVLEHFPYYSVFNVLLKWRKALVPKGELHILVPSWEWEARQVLSEQPSKALFGHTFAGLTNEWDVHKCMFRLLDLRSMFDHAGLDVINARTGDYDIMIGNEVMKAEQHYIVGVKNDNII